MASTDIKKIIFVNRYFIFNYCIEKALVTF